MTALFADDMELMCAHSMALCTHVIVFNTCFSFHVMPGVLIQDIILNTLIYWYCEIFNHAEVREMNIGYSVTGRIVGQVVGREKVGKQSV